MAAAARQSSGGEQGGEEDERLPASRQGDLPVVVGQQCGGEGSQGGGRHERPQFLE
jgi:hypothetical protein